MLVYSSQYPSLQHPQTDDELEKKRICGEMLTMISSNHIRNTRACFDTLEQNQIILGNGGFLSVSVFFDEEKLFLDRELQVLDPLVSSLRAHITAPIYFAYTTLGHLNFLLCYPRATLASEADASYVNDAKQAFECIYQDIVSDYPGIHFLISDMMTEEKSVFISANSLTHAKEYYIFRSDVPPVLHIDMQEVLHEGFMNDFNVYRSLSMQITKELIAANCKVPALAHQVKNAILENCTASMESLHHHAQIFILSLTEYLRNAGIVNSAYIEKHQIVHRIMRFESETDFENILSDLLRELRKQYNTLEAVGKKNKIVEVRDYINDNITNPDLNLQQIASVFDISPSLLTKQFREYLGLSLYQYLQRERLRMARSIIEKNPRITMQELSHKCGYNDISTMYRAFKKYDGITPGYFKESSKYS